MNRCRRIPIILVAALMAALSFVAATAGCGQSTTSTTAPTTATTATSSPTVDSKAYQDSTYGFSFQYASGWQIKKDVSMEAGSGSGPVYSMGVFDPEGTVTNDILRDGVVLSLYKLNVTVDDSMMGDLRTEVESVVADLETQQEGLKTLEPLQDVSVGGIPGFKVTYSFPADGVSLVSTLYFLFAGNLEYQVSLQSAESRWDELKPSFAAVTQSFAVKR